jgi:hypothetical protein
VSREAKLVQLDPDDELATAEARAMSSALAVRSVTALGDSIGDTS